MSSNNASNKRRRVKETTALNGGAGTRSSVTSSSSRNNSGSGSLQLLTNLPSEVLQRVVWCSDFSGRLALARTGTKFRDAVEAHEQRVYQEIKRRHRVAPDESAFDERVGDQTNLQTTITRRVKPVVLPFRYKKTVAMKTGLYKVTVGQEFRHFSLSETILSPSEDSIITRGRDRLHRQEKVQICNLRAREDVGTLVLQDGGDLGAALFLDDTRIVTRRREDVALSSSLLLWTLNRRTSGWESEPLLGPQDNQWSNGGVLDWIRSDQEIICFLKTNRSEITVLSVNTNTRVLKTLFTIEEFFSVYEVKARGVSDSKWLLFSIAGFVKGVRRERSGFYVYNLETNEESDFLEATVDYNVFKLQQAQDCSKSYFTIQDSGDRSPRRVVSFCLDSDGRLRQRSSFPVGGMTKIVAASQSGVFVRNEREMIMYNATTGKCDRSLAVGINSQVVISKRRKEFFVKHGGFDGEVAIEAFCLTEPRIM